MNEILVKQLAIDFCTSREKYLSLGRRILKKGECFLKIACINGKILASGKKDIIEGKHLKTEVPGSWTFT